MAIARIYLHQYFCDFCIFGVSVFVPCHYSYSHLRCYCLHGSRCCFMCFCLLAVVPGRGCVWVLAGALHDRTPGPVHGRARSAGGGRALPEHPSRRFAIPPRGERFRLEHKLGFGFEFVRPLKSTPSNRERERKVMFALITIGLKLEPVEGSSWGLWVSIQ